jgi:PadR family transcriptional regulator, regulatory protein PadR
MEKKLRMTYNVLRVLKALYADLDAEHYTFALTKTCDMSTSSLYLTLDRLKEFGLVTGYWEQLDPVAAGRPPRYYYKLNAEGIRLAEQEFRTFSTPTGLLHA